MRNPSRCARTTKWPACIRTRFQKPPTSSISRHEAIGYQKIQIELTPESYCREIGRARTFGFVSDVEYLKSLGLIRGGSLENAVVLDSSGIVNNHLRFPNEFVRHKLLDLLGDISLTGYPIIGHLYAERAGHAIHTALADQIARLKNHCRSARPRIWNSPWPKPSESRDRAFFTFSCAGHCISSVVPLLPASDGRSRMNG